MTIGICFNVDDCHMRIYLSASAAKAALTYFRSLFPHRCFNCASIKCRSLLTMQQKLPLYSGKVLHFNYRRNSFRSVVKLEGEDVKILTTDSV